MSTDDLLFKTLRDQVDSIRAELDALGAETDETRSVQADRHYYMIHGKLSALERALDLATGRVP